MHEVEAKTILSAHNGMNTYRGCTHGCIYCDTRSKCYGFDHAFEDIEVKVNAPQLLEKALKAKRKKCMIGTGSMSDPYNHLESELAITRKCLQLIDRYGFGATLITKSADVLRDEDLLVSINRKAKAVLQMTLTTYDDNLCRILEPNVSVTSERFNVLMRMKELGIPTVVWLSPILPYINDTEENIRGILDYCIRAKVKGIICFGMGLTLREGNREYYYDALDHHFPGLRERYERTYHQDYVVPSMRNGRLMKIFLETCRAHGILCTPDDCFSYLNEFPYREEQPSLF